MILMLVSREPLMFDVCVLLDFLDIYFVQNENFYSNNTVFNENIIDDSPSNEVNCIKRGSTIY